MSAEAQEVTSIAHVVQLAVAPVFLIAGISGMLGVLTSRLARIVDRGRKLADRLSGAAAESQAPLEHELAVLSRRARLVHLAIGFCALCALLICTVVVVLFVGAIFTINLSSMVALLFILAMASFISGLLCFLREIHLAITHLRIGPA